MSPDPGQRSRQVWVLDDSPDGRWAPRAALGLGRLHAAPGKSLTQCPQALEADQRIAERQPAEREGSELRQALVGDGRGAEVEFRQEGKLLQVRKAGVRDPGVPEGEP